MNEPIVEVIGLAHGEFVKNGVTVLTELGDSLPPIQGDRVQLQHVMLNLVINAIQAMSDVRDSKREPHVTTGDVESGECVRVAVRDTGPGPSAENVEGLFQPFYTTKPDGMGMGLSICRSIIEDHRGRLWASRIEPQGALFHGPSYSAGHIRGCPLCPDGDDNAKDSSARKGEKHMTLEQLRVFVAVAERQHVTRAAAVLNLAQSAVSAAIAALEARHGAKLFNRVGRGVELTEAGALFLVEARAVLARAEAAELVLSELGNLKRGTLAVHASQTIAGYWLPRHLVAFRHKYPGIDIRLTIGNTAQGAAAVHEGAADLAFIEGTVDDPMLTKEQVARDQLVIVVGAEHAWSAIDRLEPDRLIETDWVLREPGSGTRSSFEAALEGFDVSPGALRVALELSSNEAVRAAVEAGLGATAISASVAAPSLEAGLLHRVRFDLPERDFQVVRHVARCRSRAADELLSIVTAPFARSRAS